MLSNQDFLIVLGALAGGTYLMRASGPLLLGNRVLPRPFRAAAEVLPATLLSALVVVGGFGVGEALIVDARAAVWRPRRWRSPRGAG